MAEQASLTKLQVALKVRRVLSKAGDMDQYLGSMFGKGFNFYQATGEEINHFLTVYHKAVMATKVTRFNEDEDQSIREMRMMVNHFERFDLSSRVQALRDKMNDESNRMVERYQRHLARLGVTLEKVVITSSRHTDGFRTEIDTMEMHSTERTKC